MLVLSCCAPCSCEVIERMADKGVNATIIYYNPNVYPYEEYIKRKDENKRVAKEAGFDFIDLDYDNQKWLEKVGKGRENMGERSERCSLCFAFRVKKIAQFANENGFEIFTTTLATSRWKDKNQVDLVCNDFAEKFGVKYWDINWRSGNSEKRKQEIIKEKNIYQQKYCGCIFSKNQFDKKNLDK